MKPTYKLKSIILIILIAVTGLMPWCLAVERGNTEPTGADLGAIPMKIGEWQMVSQQLGTTSLEKSFLNNALFRIYERMDGKAVALAIAYGADQRHNFSIHVPEECYRAGGYDVTSLGFSRSGPLNISLKQLLARKESTTEAIQYWIVLNGHVVTNHFERKFKHLYYSLRGPRSDGVLVKISSLTSMQGGVQDFEVQKEFIRTLYGALNTAQKKMLFGS